MSPNDQGILAILITGPVLVGACYAVKWVIEGFVNDARRQVIANYKRSVEVASDPAKPATGQPTREQGQP